MLYVLPWVVGLLRYVVLAGLPFLVVYLWWPKVFANSKIQARPASRKDFVREVVYSVQSNFVLVAVAVAVLQPPFRGYTQVYSQLGAYPWWWVPVSIVLALVLHDTYFYWLHRLVHHPRLYRRVHLVHHQSSNPSPLAAYAFHFTEALLEALVLPIILLALPMHLLALFLFATLAFAINVYGHLGHEVAPRWLRHSVLFGVVTTSVHHNMHHAQGSCNYGLYFRFWDRAMGTEHPGYVAAYDAIQHKRFATGAISEHSKA